MPSLARLSIVMVLGLSACQTSPTGRRQFILVPEEVVEQSGLTAFQEMKAKEPLDQNPANIAYVKCVSDSITTAMAERYPWESVVFRNDDINAFALPGGKIGVFSGLLKVASTPDQLATVIGHEVGHVIAQHGRERISNQLAAQGALVLTSEMARDRDPRTYQLVMAGLGLGAQLGILLPFNRAQESEADLIGLELMAKAGFDPSQSVELWRNMAKASAGQPPEWLSTHPSHESRIRNLQNHLSSAVSIYNSSAKRAACRKP